MSRSRAYVFTINNPTEDDELRCNSLPELSRYVIIGREVGESGTPHFQGYVYFVNAKTLKAVSTLLPRARLERAKGTAEQNKEYCSKDGEIFLENGEMPISSKRKGEAEKERWAKARRSAVDGKIDDVPDDIFIKYYRTLKVIAKDYMADRADAEDVTGLWLYGVAGAGKSRKAREDYPGAYLKMCNKWWDGYQEEESVIIDDFDPNHKCLAHHLKIWSDRYAFLAETKGGAIKIRPKKIVVTSQYAISEIFEDLPTREALLRRFRCIRVLPPLGGQPGGGGGMGDETE